MHENSALSFRGDRHAACRAVQPDLGPTEMSTELGRRERLGHLRLLVPINAEAPSRWGLDYAIAQRRAGSEVEVIVLNVGEIIDQWQVLRFRTQREVVDFQAARAQAFIEQAKEQLAGHDIACQGVFKQGAVVFSILDAAEELDCDEIVVPVTPASSCALFCRSVGDELARKQRAIPVVRVDSEGRAVGGKAGRPN